MLKFHLITDTHYYDYKTLGWSEHKDQTVVNESGAVLDAIFDKLIADKSTDLVLMAGDLCTNGHRANTAKFIPMLRRLQEGGKRVILITASHDYYRVDHSEDGEEGPNPDMVYRDDLYGLYYEFGFSEAIASYGADPLSYVAQLAPGYRVLCLNTDGRANLEGVCGWAVEQIQKAHGEGEFIFAINHYPMLPPSPIYPIVAPHDGVRDEFMVRLTDGGLRFVFTGHTHMQNIAHFTTPASNKLYEINTGSATGTGAPIRAYVRRLITNLVFSLESIQALKSESFSKETTSR